jgi:hypothetical protein
VNFYEVSRYGEWYDFSDKSSHVNDLENSHENILFNLKRVNAFEYILDEKGSNTLKRVKKKNAPFAWQKRFIY